MVRLANIVPEKNREQVQLAMKPSVFFVSSDKMFLSRYLANFVENRGGLAPLTGKMLVPSQFLSPDEKESLAIMREAKSYYGDRLQSVQVANEDTELSAYVLWPQGWDRTDLSRCVIYHNPNGVTTSQFFEGGVLGWTPAEVMEMERCPMLFYDYRGTGTNKGVKANSCLIGRRSSTYASVIRDGEAMLHFAKDHLGFKKVTMWGSSLGAAVATVATERYLRERNWTALKEIQLVSHDSFTTTSRVVAPRLKRLADFFGRLLGIHINAENPLKVLVAKGLKVTVLCHLDDPVIPKGARMAELFKERCPDNVTLYSSPRYGHGFLSADMIDFLKAKG